MIDKIVAVPREKLAKCIGRVDKKTMKKIYVKLIDFLNE
jgi:mRNA-degrading endonuclease toxin of MazEF toxin-antitoxin module